MLIKKSDLNLLVVRHGVNKMNEIRQCIDNFTQINKSDINLNTNYDIYTLEI